MRRGGVRRGGVRSRDEKAVVGRADVDVGACRCVLVSGVARWEGVDMSIGGVKREDGVGRVTLGSIVTCSWDCSIPIDDVTMLGDDVIMTCCWRRLFTTGSILRSSSFCCLHG